MEGMTILIRTRYNVVENMTDSGLLTCQREYVKLRFAFSCYIPQCLHPWSHFYKILHTAKKEH